MAAPNHYRTLTGLPPNGGVPPNRMFVQAPMPPPPDNGPPHGGRIPNRGQPPPYAAYGDPFGIVFYPDYQPFPVPYPVPAPYPVAAVPAVCPLLMGLAPPPAAPPALPAAAPAYAPYEPPGQYVDGHQLVGPGYTYIPSKDNVKIHFIGDGSRPCDYAGDFKIPFDYSVHLVPCNMTVRELMTQLGMPEDGDKGLTEVIKTGGNTWQAGDTFTYHGAAHDRTLGQIGWTAAKGTVWVCIKR